MIRFVRPVRLALHLPLRLPLYLPALLPALLTAIALYAAPPAAMAEAPRAGSFPAPASCGPVAAATSRSVAAAASASASICALPAPGAAARRLFATGFGAGVDLTPLTGHGSDYQLLRGADAGGDRLPIDLWGVQPATSGILAIVGARVPEPSVRYIRNELATVTGHDGRPTRALSMQILRASPATCCTQDSFQLGVLRGAEPVFYQRYRARLDEGVLARAKAQGAGRFWRMLWEMKAEPDDYRIRLELQIDRADRLYWRIQGDRLVNADALWAYENPVVPVVPGRWFNVEICMDRPKGRFWAAVDGRLIGAHEGDLYGARRLKTSSVKHAILYGEPAEGGQWIDDLEIWDGVPCAGGADQRRQRGD